MPYYKDLTDKLHYIENDSFAYLLPSGSVKISDEDYQEMVEKIESSIIPNEVTMAQARLALYEEGLLGLVDETISLMPITEQREKAKIQWEFETKVNRNSALVYGLAGGLGLTDKMLDDLFIKASKI